MYTTLHICLLCSVYKACIENVKHFRLEVRNLQFFRNAKFFEPFLAGALQTCIQTS